jgi:hypothetical protein
MKDAIMKFQQTMVTPKRPSVLNDGPFSKGIKQACFPIRFGKQAFSVYFGGNPNFGTSWYARQSPRGLTFYLRGR